jgi:hypothetical protein
MQGKTLPALSGVDSARLLSPTPLGYVPCAAGMWPLDNRKMLSPYCSGE